MPGLTRQNKVNNSSSNSSPSSTCSSSSPSSTNCYSNSIWSRSNTEDVSFSQLQKFWNGLPGEARRALLRIDKQTLFEQVRKNLYCSRCHGLLVEGFSQIIMYGKNHLLGRGNSRKVFPESELGSSGFSSVQDERDPSLHPWGGLAATRDSALTVLDCFLDGTSLEVLQNVFESARGRERERELLYPDACGGNGRGWISQSNVYSSGRGYGMKETCALHTARLSCEALVDFWSALSEETRRSLLRMKEEDFIERLMFRFDSKRFCRDCRRNVLREFKEMKELKRTRKETRCTRWFCAADSAFQYEVSDNTLVADWRDSFAGDVGNLYEHFEWALGTADGKDDIFGFEDVGLSHRVEVEGLELSSFSDCFITIRAWRRDGRCNELTVKAHALKGELCVHRRLFVGDGFVSITEGESIQRFFEHAEETEEEEDEDAFDRDGNEIEGEGSRLQKHAKSPELARDFLLDAATVIFKEQVEKAFREGTARQNAHSIFVCLALGLLEDRVRVACKEIATLEKQNKLLEEEEHEKREEEERRERRKLKEKEKKQRRKEKLKNKERDKDNKSKPGKLAADGKQDEEFVVSEARLVSDDSECSVRQSFNEEDTGNSFIIEQSKAAKRRESKRQQQQQQQQQQQVADAQTRHLRRVLGRCNQGVSSDSALQERHSNGECLKSRSEQCGCTTGFRVKVGDQMMSSREASSKVVLRKASKKNNSEAQNSVKQESLSTSWDENNENGIHENGGIVEAEAGNDPLSEKPQVESGDQLEDQQDITCVSTPAPDPEGDTCSSSTETGNESLELEADTSQSHCSESSATSKAKEDEEDGESKESSTSPTSSAAAPSLQVSSPPSAAAGVNRSNAPQAPNSLNSEAPRNGPVMKHSTGGAAVEMHLPQQARHPAHAPVNHHHHHQLLPQQQHHPQQFAYHQAQVQAQAHWQARGNLMQPLFIPAPATLGFPRFPVPPRMFHPQMRMAAPPPPPPPPPPRPGYVPWVPVNSRPASLQQIHHHHQHHQQQQHQQLQHQQHQLQHQQQVSECGMRNSSGFSLFHFGGASPVAEVMEPEIGSPVNHHHHHHHHHQQQQQQHRVEEKEDEVVVSSKCMDRLPSGIAMGSMMGGEYRLFAAAPGKVFGFF